jgi:hypothetical protein
MKTEKIIGFSLVLIGIGIIIASAYSVYQVFTGEADPPSVFHFEAPSITLPTQQSLSLELPEGMELPEGFSLPSASEEEKEPQKIKLLPDEVINKVVNMSIHLLLMGFLVTVGAKIAGIGTKLVKEIKVVVKEEKIKAAQAQ